MAVFRPEGLREGLRRGVPGAGPPRSKNLRFVEAKRSKSQCRTSKFILKNVCSDASKSTKMVDSIAFWPFLGRQICGAKIVKKSSQSHDSHNSEFIKSTKIDDSTAFLHLFGRTVSGALGTFSFKIGHGKKYSDARKTHKSMARWQTTKRQTHRRVDQNHDFGLFRPSASARASKHTALKNTKIDDSSMF